MEWEALAPGTATEQGEPRCEAAADLASPAAVVATEPAPAPGAATEPCLSGDAADAEAPAPKAGEPITDALAPCPWGEAVAPLEMMPRGGSLPAAPMESGEPAGAATEVGQFAGGAMPAENHSTGFAAEAQVPMPPALVAPQSPALAPMEARGPALQVAVEPEEPPIFYDADPVPPPAPTPSQGVAGSDVQTLGVFLEEVGYFLEDMDRDLWWLLRAAHQPEAGFLAALRGDEDLLPVAPETQAIIDRLRERAELHLDSHENQVRSKITIIPGVVPEERAVLHALRNLKFHCKGKIEVFRCMKEANNSAIWGAYFNCVSIMEPHWMFHADVPGAKLLFAQCTVIVPVYVNRIKKEISLLSVWCPEKKKRHWAFPGGDILRGGDRHLFDTARRVFEQEVGCFFNRRWEQCFITQLPEEASSELTDPTGCLYVHVEKDGHRYPSRPHILGQVTEDFYETTRCYEDATGVIKLPTPDGEYVRWDDQTPGSARRVHLDGVRFLEHDEARWVPLEFNTGRIQADDGRQFRKENAELFKQMPEKIWNYLADLAGLEHVQQASVLPSDFPTDGPFSVRMSGIDKHAVDQDISTYFEENDVKVKKVEQFDIPRHTARIDFFDLASLEQALQLSGRNLLRRKVKVELWADSAGCAPGVRPLKPYSGPLPSEGPFKVCIRGLDRTVDRDDLGYFFHERRCQVSDVEFPIKERHAGIVEFVNQESLKTALGLNGSVFKNREVSVELPSDKPADRPTVAAGGAGGGGKGRGKGRGKGGAPDRGAFGDREREGAGMGGRSERNEREPPSRSEFGSERPRLALKPRSIPLPGEPGYREEQPQRGAPSGPRPDPFSGARPREDRFKPTRADGDDNWRR